MLHLSDAHMKPQLYCCADSSTVSFSQIFGSADLKLIEVEKTLKLIVDMYDNARSLMIAGFKRNIEVN